MPAVLAVRVEQIFHRDIGLHAPVALAQRRHELSALMRSVKRHRRDDEQASQQPERRGQPERTEREAVGVPDLERDAQQRVAGTPTVRIRRKSSV